MDIEQVLLEMFARSASDVYLLAGSPPAFRVDGQIVLAEGLGPADPIWLTQAISSLLNDEQRERFFQGHDVEFLTEIGRLGRFQGRAAVKSGNMAMVLCRAHETAVDDAVTWVDPSANHRNGLSVHAPAGPIDAANVERVIEPPGNRASLGNPAAGGTPRSIEPGIAAGSLPPLEGMRTTARAITSSDGSAGQQASAGRQGGAIGLEALLRLMREKEASDMHLVVGGPPAFRIHGQIVIAEDLAPVDNLWLARNLGEMLNEPQLEAFHNDLELDFAVDLGASGRFRGNAALERGNISLVFRRITELDLDIDSLGLPGVCKQLALKPRGLVIVTGTVGSGKSTTLAAMIEYVNTNTRRRVVTLEDPIEYIFSNKRSIITQRQVGEDTRSFMGALSRVLRQNPDVIMVGEARDSETVAAVLTASETGHLVLTTAHAPSAAQTIEGIIGRFPPYQQPQIRTQLASILEGVFYQKLVPRADGKGRVAAIEVMLGTYAVRNLIREGKTHQLFSAIQLGGNQGMQTLDQALLHHCLQGTIAEQAALAVCHDADQLTQELRSAGRGRRTVVG